MLEDEPIGETFEGMTALVTGINGFVGANMAVRLLEEGFRVVGMFRDLREHNPIQDFGLTDSVTLVQASINHYKELERILSKYEVDMVFHFAAESIVSSAGRMPTNVLKSNVQGTWTVLEAVRNVDEEIYTLVASSDKVYGQHENLPLDESAPLLGDGIYEMSKVCTDVIARSYAKNYDMPIVVSRAVNLFGPGDRNKRIVPNTIRDILDNKPPLIFNLQYEDLREYLYVKDAIEAFLTLMKHMDKLRGQAVNVGSGLEYQFVKSQADVVLLILELCAERGLVSADLVPERIDKDGVPEIQRQFVDGKKIKSLGWMPRYDMREGLLDTIDWWGRQHPEHKALYQEVENYHHGGAPGLPPPPTDNIVFCTICKKPSDVVENVELVSPHVDRVVIISEELPKGDIAVRLAHHEAEVMYAIWKDNFSEYRNTYIDAVNDGDWILMCDHDEIFCKEFLANVRKIVEESVMGRRYNQVTINSHDVTIDEDGNLGEERVSDFYKPLLFRKHTGVHYTGTPHETLHGSWRPLQAPPEFYYIHSKSQDEVWEHGSRNFYISGGGDNEKPPVWNVFRRLCADHGIQDWHTMKARMVKGNLPHKVRAWILDHHNWNEIPRISSEVRELYKWYFLHLHPEQLGKDFEEQPIPEAPPDPIEEKINALYKEILGREVDGDGLKHYGTQLRVGNMTEDDIRGILRNSDEYKQKAVKNDNADSPGS